MDLDEERQVSAGEVAKVLSVIETEAVSYIFAEELYGKAMCETIQKEADVTVIYLDPLNRGEYEADSYIDAMSRNIQLLKDAFRNEI
jgi:zinc transport system substrate-binding protein